MKKRIVCILAFFTLLAGCIPLQGASAANTPKYVSESKSVYKDDIFTIDVAVSDNTGIISLRFKVVYDTSVLELQGIANSGLLNGYTTPSPTITSPYTLRWADSFATSDNSENGTVATLTFKVLKAASSTSVKIEHEEARTVLGQKVEFANTESNITIDIFPDTSGVVETTLDSIVDYENRIIFTEIQNTTDVKTLFTKGNDKISSVTPSYTFNETIQHYGTGTVINIDVDNVIARYILVVDGDINGDGVCDVLDATAAGQFAAGKSKSDKYQRYAAKGQSFIDEEISASDYSSLVNKTLKK